MLRSVTAVVLIASLQCLVAASSGPASYALSAESSGDEDGLADPTWNEAMIQRMRESSKISSYIYKLLFRAMEELDRLDNAEGAATFQRHRRYPDEPAGETGVFLYPSERFQKKKQKVEQQRMRELQKLHFQRMRRAF